MSSLFTEELQRIINSFIIVIILFTISYIITSIIFPSTEKKITKFERFVFIWLIWDALIHLILEGSFVILSLISTVEESKGILAELCMILIILSFLYKKKYIYIFIYIFNIFIKIKLN